MTSKMQKTEVCDTSSRKGVKTMKKLVSVFCVLAMALSMFSATAFAAEPKTVTDAEIISMEKNDFGVDTRATSKGLWYEENTTNWGGVAGAVYNAPVTPEKGAALNVWLKNDAPVTMQVYETNWFGGYTKVYQSGTLEAGERDIKVVNKCNGKKYLVQLNRKLSNTTTISILVYQN